MDGSGKVFFFPSSFWWGCLKAAVWRPYNLRDVGSVFVVMMTLDPITPASGSPTSVPCN